MWQKCEKNNMMYYTLPSWQKLGADVYVSCRQGGISEKGCDSLNLARHVEDNPVAVTENRRRFFAALEVNLADFVGLQQTHSKNVCQVTAADRGKGLDFYDNAIAHTDGLYTSDNGVLMATFYADCLPIALFDPNNGVLALCHAGWKGTYQNIGAVTLEAMARDFGTAPADAFVAFGPGIGPCCYEVDSEFYERFLSQYDFGDDWFKPGSTGKYFFDNAGANKELLIKAGVVASNITEFPLCTCCNQDLFYSYRGSGGNCGRHGLFGRLR